MIRLEYELKHLENELEQLENKQKRLQYGLKSGEQSSYQGVTGIIIQK